jgi:hypothetical protein
MTTPDQVGEEAAHRFVFPLPEACRGTQAAAEGMASFGTDGIEGNIAETAAERSQDPCIGGKDGTQ